jgi:hypothetical protein
MHSLVNAPLAWLQLLGLPHRFRNDADGRWEDRNGMSYGYTYGPESRCVATDRASGSLSYTVDYECWAQRPLIGMWVRRGSAVSGTSGCSAHVSELSAGDRTIRTVIRTGEQGAR